MAKSHIFTNVTLDGTMSYIVFRWLTGRDNISYTCTKVSEFRENFLHWLSHHNANDYNHIYIFGLDVTECCSDILDRSNIVIIDHHNNLNVKYNHSKVFVRKFSSCSKLIYKLLQNKTDCKLTNKQKHLLLLADDYESYQLQLIGSYELNILFWTYQGDRLKRLISEFNDGFFGFNKTQKNIISFYNKKTKQIKSQLNMFSANIPIGDKSYKFVSTFASDCINEVADYIIERNNADVGIVINPNNNRVSFRRSKLSCINLLNMAKKITNGGGYEYAAGGMITDQFLSFSKLLKPIK